MSTPSWLPPAPEGALWLNMGRGQYMLTLPGVSLQATQAGIKGKSSRTGRTGYQPISRAKPATARDMDDLLTYATRGELSWTGEKK